MSVFLELPPAWEGGSAAHSACVGCGYQQHSAWEGCTGSQPDDPLIGVLPGAPNGCGRISRQVPIILPSPPLNDCRFDVLTNPEKNHPALSKQREDGPMDLHRP